MTFEDAEEFFYVGTSYTQHSQFSGDTGKNCTPEMNGLMELLRSQQRRLGELEYESSISERRAAVILEGERRQFHHDVLCLALKECMNQIYVSRDDELVESVNRSRRVADLAYPPPNAEP